MLQLKNWPQGENNAQPLSLGLVLHETLQESLKIFHEDPQSLEDSSRALQILLGSWKSRQEDLHLSPEKSYLWECKFRDFLPRIQKNFHQCFFYPSFSVSFALTPRGKILTLGEAVEKLFSPWGENIVSSKKDLESILIQEFPLMSFHQGTHILKGPLYNHRGPKIVFRCSFSAFSFHQESCFVEFFTTKDQPTWISLESGQTLSLGVLIFILHLGFRYFSKDFLLFLQIASLDQKTPLMDIFSGNFSQEKWNLGGISWVFFHKFALGEKQYTKDTSGLLTTYGHFLENFLHYMDHWYPKGSE